jgi:hypothetical protein
VIAIPTAFAIMASLETVALALVLRRAMRLRMSPATATAFA